MLRGVWQALKCLSIHATYCVIIAGAFSGETKNVGCGTWKRRFFAVGHRKTEPGWYFCRKLTLTRTPDPIRPTRRGPDPNRPSSGKKQGGLWCRGVCPGSFGRTSPETIGDSRTKFNRILCTSKSEAAVTTNKKTALYVEADYRQVRSIARPLCDSWASCILTKAWHARWRHVYHHLWQPHRIVKSKSRCTPQFRKCNTHY